jgi:hypothetical protein
MIPLILGFGSAALFLALSMWVYGLNVLAENAWAALVFWGLVGSGVAVFAIAMPKPAWLCRLHERIGFADDLCDAPACGAC